MAIGLTSWHCTICLMSIHLICRALSCIQNALSICVNVVDGVHWTAGVAPSDSLEVEVEIILQWNYPSSAPSPCCIAMFRVISIGSLEVLLLARCTALYT